MRHKKTSKKFDPEKIVSNDIANCTACGASCLGGTDMFECITYADLWIFCVDCKLASDLRPSYTTNAWRAIEAKTRKCFIFLYLVLSLGSMQLEVVMKLLVFKLRSFSAVFMMAMNFSFDQICVSQRNLTAFVLYRWRL